MNGIKLNPTIRLKVLSDDQIEAIHDASLRILEKTGIRFDGDAARDRLLKSGAVAHPSKKGVITFPRSMVEDAIEKLPRNNVYHARDRRRDIRYDGEHVFPYAGGGDPKMLDLDSGQPRPSTYGDVEMASRLGDIGVRI